MDTFLAILLIAAIFGGVLLWQKITGAAQTKLNQKVYSRRSHTEGTQLTGEIVTYVVTASAEDTREAILDGLRLAPEVPLAIPDTYLLRSTPTRIEVAYGCKPIPVSFLMVATFSEDDEDGTTVVTTGFPTWTTADGVATGTGAMRRLRQQTRQALIRLDPELRRLVSNAAG